MKDDQIMSIVPLELGPDTHPATWSFPWLMELFMAFEKHSGLEKRGYFSDGLNGPRRVPARKTTIICASRWQETRQNGC